MCPHLTGQRRPDTPPQRPRPCHARAEPDQRSALGQPQAVLELVGAEQAPWQAVGEVGTGQPQGRGPPPHDRGGPPAQRAAPPPEPPHAPPSAPPPPPQPPPAAPPGPPPHP